MRKRRLNLMAWIMGLASIGVVIGLFNAFLGSRDLTSTALASSERSSSAKSGKTSGPAVIQLGKSGLALPRFVSLKRDRVNVRRGPSSEHSVSWVFTQRERPVEIVAEFEHWRRIRDADGQEGWIYHSLLQGRRTALVAPWMKGELVNLYDRPSKDAALIAKVSGGAIGQLQECNGQWCRLSFAGHDGFVKQNMLWGAYPDERIN